jgi:hypothetical protein|tara:strand:+ start:471 stop:701 length:231 start_codon:yes stop_codon:yes gene_type:complete
MKFFTGFKNGFQAFGHHIAHLVNFILLTGVYIIAVGPTKLIAKLSGKHFLITKMRKTNWVKRENKEESYDDYLRSF